MGVHSTNLPIVHTCSYAAVIGEAALQHLGGENLVFRVEGCQRGHRHIFAVSIVQEEDICLKMWGKEMCIMQVMEEYIQWNPS